MKNEDLLAKIGKAQKNISLSNLYYLMAIIALVVALFFSHENDSLFNLVIIVIMILLSVFLFLFGFQLYNKNHKLKNKYEFIINYQDAQLRELRFVVLERNRSSHIAKDLITDLIHSTDIFDHEEIKEIPSDLVLLKKNNQVSAAKRILRNKDIDKEKKVIIRSLLIRHVLNHSEQNTKQVLTLLEEAEAFKNAAAVSA